MRTWTEKLMNLTIGLIVAGSRQAQAGNASEPYVDDGLDLVDVESVEKGKDAPDLVPLAGGLEPVHLEQVPYEPDDRVALETKGARPKANTGPLVGTNFIRITVSDNDVNAGSNMDYVYARFGQSSGNDDGSDPYQIRLWGFFDGSDYSFPRGWTLTWDLEQVEDYLADVPQDNWDHISLVTPSGDGLLIARVEIVHSGVEILDWSVNRWLDSPNDTTLGLAAKITERKLQHVGNSNHAAIHAGALDLGKTDGYKYGSGDAWCSEFASWALWKEGFMTPAGNIASGDLKAWFSAQDRLYTRAQVKSKTYVPKQGDYLSINDGGHSCLFLEWVDPTDTITDNTRFRTLDGNAGSTVKICNRTVGVIDAVGKAQ